MPSKDQSCQKEACAIQKCLEENGYQQDKCEPVIQKMIECCQKDNYKSYICQGYKAAPKNELETSS